MKKHWGIIVGVGVTAFILLSMNVSSDEPTAEKVLAFAQNAWQGAKGVSADVSVEVIRDNGKTIKKGTVEQKNTKAFRVECDVTFPDKEPIKILVVSDGKTLWRIIKNVEGEVQSINVIDISTADEFVPAVIRPRIGAMPEVGILAEHFSLTYAGTESVDGEKAYVLAGKRKAENPEKGGALFERIIPKSMKIYISATTGLPVKIEQTQESGREISVVFRNVKTGVELPESFFIFTPPKGAPIFHTTNILKAIRETLEEGGDEPAANDE